MTAATTRPSHAPRTLRVLLAALLTTATLLAIAGPATATPATAATAAAGTLTPTEAFVTATYHDFLGRAPNDTGLAYWTTQLDSGVSRVAYLTALVHTTEWATHAVTGFYHTILLREPDQGGLAYWTDELVADQVPLARIAALFYGSSEDFNDAGHANDHDWVASLYTALLHRDADDDPTGVAYWVAQIASTNRVTVAKTLYRSHEARLHRIGDLYQRFLQRDPDPTGAQYWAQILLTSGQRTVAIALAASAEYYSNAQTRFGGPPTPTWQILPAQQVTLHWVVVAINDHGLLAGTLEEHTGAAVTCTTPCTQPTVLATPPGYDTVIVDGINNNGITYGTAFKHNSGTTAGVLWPSPTAAPVVLPQPTDVNGTGTIMGVSNSGMIVNAGHTWASPTATPVPLPKLANSPADQVSATALTPSGTILGTDFTSGGIYTPLVWTSPTASPSRLNVLPNWGNTSPTAMLTSGAIVGTGVDPDNNRRPLIWASETATPTELALPTSYTAAHVLAGAGTDIIGVGTDAGGTDHFLVWTSATATPAPLALPQGDQPGIAADINTHGAIVAQARGSANSVTSLAWSSPTATSQQLPGPQGPCDAMVTGASPTGVVLGLCPSPPGYAGHSKGGFTPPVPVLWGTPTAAPTTLQLPKGSTTAVPLDMSRPGQIVGLADTGGGATAPAFWASASATPTLLALPGSDDSVAGVGITDQGTIVGTVFDGTTNSTRAYRWSSATAQPTPLSAPPNSTTRVTSVTPTGTIVGSGGNASTGSKALLWTSPTAAPTVLPDPTGSTSRSIVATGVSATGEIVGYTQNQTEQRVNPLVWASATATPTVLPVPTGTLTAEPVGVTDSGAIVALAIGAPTQGPSQDPYAFPSPRFITWSSPAAQPTTVQPPEGYRPSLPSSGLLGPDNLTLVLHASADGHLYGSLLGPGNRLVGFVHNP